MLRRPVKKILTKIRYNNFQTLNSVELDKSKLLSNFALFKRLNPEFGIIPVLKANAYGHGLEQVAEILNDADCDYLAVDGYFEAAKIRDITNHKILVLGYIKPANVKLLDTKKCTFVVQDIEGLEAFASLNKPVKVHLELNTGMNRLGLQSDELMPYLQTLIKHPSLILDGVMTHLADADNPYDDLYTIRQTNLFDGYIKSILDFGLNPKYIHIAQTAGSTKTVSKYANSMRLGIGLYGINPLEAGDKHFNELSELQPVLELKSTVIKTIEMKTGDKVSYNGIFTAPKTMKIGVLPLGYYEGIPRELSNKGLVTYGNQALPIVGRVCMNHTMIDLKSEKVKIGDTVIVISRQTKQLNSIVNICRDNGLFSYSLLTGLSSSIRRVIV